MEGNTMTKKEIQHLKTLNKTHIIFNNQEVNYNPTKDEFYSTILGFNKLPVINKEYINVVKKLKQNNEVDKDISVYSRSWAVIKHFEPVLNRIVIDVDSENLKDSLKTTRNIIDELKEYSQYINIYFSGSKGFHIEMDCEPLDIIDITTDRAGDCCLQYKEFLNYFKDKYNEVDTSITDGTRQFRQPHSVHKKTGNYKVLVDITKDLDTILKNSKKDKDMVEKKGVMNSKIAMEILNTYNKPLERKRPVTKEKYMNNTNKVVSYDVSKLQSKLYEIDKKNGNTTHSTINILGFCCTNCLNEMQARELARQVDSNTGSKNAYESFMDAYYNNDNPDKSLGALYNRLELYYSVEDGHPDFDTTNEWKDEKKARYRLFNEFKVFLHGTRIKNNYIKFQQILKENNNDLVKILKENVLDYIKNDEVLAIEIMLSLMSGLGLEGSFIKLNAPAGIGKTENKNALFRLIPNGNELGKITSSALYRLDEKDFNRQVIYCNDKGLEKGQQQQASEEAKGVYRELVTDKKIKKIISNRNTKGVFKYEVTVDATSLFETELYTIDDGDRMGRQMARVTVQLDIDTPTKEEYIKMLMLMQDPKNKEAVKEFNQMHSDYMEYLQTNGDTEVIIPKNILMELAEPCIDLTAINRAIALYRTYCIYFNVNPTNMENVIEYRKFFRQIKEIGKYEQYLYDYMKKILTPFDINNTDLTTNTQDNDVVFVGGVMSEYDKYRVTEYKKVDGKYVNRRGNPIYFVTVNDAKSYLQIFRKRYKLHGYKDNAGDFLYTLEKKGFLDCIHTKGDERLYYIPKEA